MSYEGNKQGCEFVLVTNFKVVHIVADMIRNRFNSFMTEVPII